MNSLYRFILLSLLFAVNSYAQKAPFVSFDIDWVSFYTLEQGHKAPESETYFVEEKTYIPTPYLREVVQTLLKRGFSIGFISGGEISRNHLQFD